LHDVRRLRAVVPAILLLLAVTAVASAGSRDAELGRLAADGPVVLSSSKNGVALLQGAHIVPGDSITGLITLSNKGDKPGTLALVMSGVRDRPGAYGGRLSSVLRVRLEDLTSGRPPIETTLARNTPISLGDLPGRQSRTYRVIASFPDTGTPAGPALGDNLLQGSSVEVGLAWHLTAKETAVPKPPKPPVTPAPVGGAPPVITPVPAPTPGRPALVHLRVPAQRVIKPRKLSVFAKCDVRCKLRFSAKIDNAPKAKKAKKGKKATTRRTLMGKRVVKRERKWSTIKRVAREKRVYLKLTKRALKRLKRQLHRKGRAGITVTVKMRSAAGNRTVRRRIVMRTYKKGYRGKPAKLRG
jgi:hypothetical protein